MIIIVTLLLLLSVVANILLYVRSVQTSGPQDFKLEVAPKQAAWTHKDFGNLLFKKPKKL
jgi:hypothetical protein